MKFNLESVVVVAFMAWLFAVGFAMGELVEERQEVDARITRILEEPALGRDSAAWPCDRLPPVDLSRFSAVHCVDGEGALWFYALERESDQ